MYNHIALMNMSLFYLQNNLYPQRNTYPILITIRLIDRSTETRARYYPSQPLIKPTSTKNFVNKTSIRLQIPTQLQLQTLPSSYQQIKLRINTGNILIHIIYIHIYIYTYIHTYMHILRLHTYIYTSIFTYHLHT